MQRNSKEYHKGNTCEEGDDFSAISEGSPVSNPQGTPPTCRSNGGSQTNGNGATESQIQKKVGEDGDAKVSLAEAV